MSVFVSFNSLVTWNVVPMYFDSLQQVEEVQEVGRVGEDLVLRVKDFVFIDRPGFMVFGHAEYETSGVRNQMQFGDVVVFGSLDRVNGSKDFGMLVCGVQRKR